MGTNIQLREEAAGRILHVRIDGNPDKSGSTQIVAETRRLVKEHGALALLVEFTSRPDSTVRAPWDDVDFSLDHFTEIGLLAVVGVEEGDWLSGFVKPFTQTGMKFFPAGDAAGARRWLDGHIGDLEGATITGGKLSWWDSYRRQAIIALVLSGIGLAGLMLQHFMKASVWWFWLLIVLPTFGFAGIRLERGVIAKDRKITWPLVRSQLLHWSGFAVSLILIRILIRNGSLIESDSGLVSLMTLALSCYFAGAHLNRVFFMVAAILTAVFVFASFVEGSIWGIFAIVAVAIAGIVVYQKWFAKDEPKPDTGAAEGR